VIFHVELRVLRDVARIVRGGHARRVPLAGRRAAAMPTTMPA
jgi:hypothetical protein